jgi:hypothetical protein
LDDAGKIVKEVKVASEPQALLKVLGNPAYPFKRIGLEAGPLSQWLFSALAEAKLPVICVETRHMQAVLKAQINNRYNSANLSSVTALSYVTGQNDCNPIDELCELIIEEIKYLQSAGLNDKPAIMFSLILGVRLSPRLLTSAFRQSARSTLARDRHLGWRKAARRWKDEGVKAGLASPSPPVSPRWTHPGPPHRPGPEGDVFEVLLT